MLILMRCWDTGMSNTVKDPKGPPELYVHGRKSFLANPDDSSNIGLANIQFQCLTGNCSGETISVSTVPNFDSVVGNSAGVYDSNMHEKYLHHSIDLA